MHGSKTALKPTILELIGALIVVLDRDGRIIQWNRACTDLTGYELEEARGRLLWEFLLVPEAAEAVERVFATQRAAELLSRFESDWVTKRGDRCRVAWSNTVVLGPTGNVERIIATGVHRPESERVEEQLRVSEAELASIVSISADAIVSIDDEERIVRYNEGAEQIFGWSREEVLGKRLDLLIPDRFRRIHRQHVRDFAAAPLSTRRVGERPLTIAGLRKNGEEFAAEAAISRLEIDGTNSFTVVLRDVTEQKRGERNQVFLSEAGAVLSSTLDYPQTLTNIAELALLLLADCCIIDLVEEDGSVRTWKVAHRDPAKSRLADALERSVLDRNKPHLVGAVLETRRPVLVSDVSDEHLQSIAQNPECLRLLRELDPVSYIGLPLTVRGRMLGAMVLVSSDPRRRHALADVTLGEDLAYRAALALDNAQLYRSAQRAIQARDDVLNIVAHDLRNPLNACALAAATLLCKPPDEDGWRFVTKGAEIIVRSIKRANRLIQDLLDVARIETGKLAIERTRVPSRDLVVEASETFGAMASDTSLELRVEIPRELPAVSADRERVLQIFANLVDNAIKFTPPGGRILLGAARSEDEVCFSVADSGPGIPPEEVPHLFDRFWQARRTDRRGAGLGLSIAKGLVEAHGGRIWLESTAGAAGSTFHFTLPVAPEDQPSGPPSCLQPAAGNVDGVARVSDALRAA